MISSFVDAMLPDGSDDEYEHQPCPRFTFQTSGDIEPRTEVVGGFPQCRAVFLCCEESAITFALHVFKLRLMHWSFDIEKGQDKCRDYSFPMLPKPPHFYTAEQQNTEEGVVVFVLLDGPVHEAFADAWAEGFYRAFSGATDIFILDTIFQASWRGSQPPFEPNLCPFGRPCGMVNRRACDLCLHPTLLHM